MARAILVLLAVTGTAISQGQDASKAPDLARVKEEEAREKLERLEEAMDRLSRALAQTEPQNAAKLKLAFREARDRLVREGMDRVIKYLNEKKLDRALEEQTQVKVNLEELLSILLEKDVDPRELLRHIRKLRDTVTGLDKVIQDETSEKMASDDAEQSEASSAALKADLAELEDLIRRQKKIEKEVKDPANASKDSLGALAPEEAAIRSEAKRLRESDEKREAEAKPSPGGAPKPVESPPAPGGEPSPPGEGEETPNGGVAEPPPGAEAGPPKPAEPPPARPGSVLDKKKLEEAESALAQAEDALKSGDQPKAGANATEAREKLEEANTAATEKLERLRAARDYKKMKEDQDETKKETDALADRMLETPPLVSSPEGGVPGRQDVEAASQEMQDASQNLGLGKPRGASKSQKEALDKLKQGREQAEETLEELQKALRERLLSYLREKFTKMLNDQRAVTRETKSLDLKLRALRAAAGLKETDVFEPDRKDRQTSESLAAREAGITLLAVDVIDLLSEDGTTLVFPGVVEEVKSDLENARGLLSRLQTGDRTQRIQTEIEAAIEDILKALENAQRSPPPPNPSQGRSSKSGAGPLLPLSAELKMVRALQARVNERTRAFDLGRKPEGTLSPESKLQLGAIQKKQTEVEEMLRKLKETVGER